MAELSEFFKSYVQKESIFTDKSVFLSSYLPETIHHRDTQINQIAQILAPILRKEKPSNLFIYGKTGTGKTLSIKHVIKEITAASNETGLQIRAVYINCKLKRVADTEYRLLAQLSREFGKELPSTGLPTDEVYRVFFNAVDQQECPILLVLDEIDQLIKKTGDSVLYNLLRANDESAKSFMAIVGLSNDMVFIDNLDPRVRSSLSEEEIIFPPYNAFQIQDILKQRISIAFKEGVLEQGTIEKCSAYSAREHGDARRAIELIRVAAELAERTGTQKVTLKHIDQAEEKIERDRISDIVANQPKQSQCILYSIVSLSITRKGPMFTGEIYGLYRNLCSKTGLRPLTQRRVSDVLSELDLFGIINAKIISKGRYGRTREVFLNIPEVSTHSIKETLLKSLDIRE
ncbi:ORC1-type DNA replication protein [Candidatus Woesearchaeota archaeon]|nr:ORC1-type DNA replication protein [Candidatus Woesearchaeota archaeon]